MHCFVAGSVTCQVDTNALDSENYKDAANKISATGIKMQSVFTNHQRNALLWMQVGYCKTTVTEVF